MAAVESCATLDRAPESAAVHHALGLLLVRLQRQGDALIELARAAELEPERARYAYVYAVGLHSAGRAGEAMTVLKDTLARHPGEFSGIFVAVVGAGEQSGSLGAVLEHLANDLEDQQALNAKLLGAALYPAIVSLVALAIVAVTLMGTAILGIDAGVEKTLSGLGDDVLYVGKAKALKNRVANYLQVERLPLRLKRMVSQTRGMTIVTTNSEAEALLLEAQLIKRYRPPYKIGRAHV